MNKAFIAATALLLCATAHASETPWVRGANAWGGQGLQETDAALATVPGQLVFFAAETAYSAGSLFVAGDSAYAFDTLAGLAWTPLRGLQVGLNAAFTSFGYTSFVVYGVRAVGNPSLHLKYGYEVAPGWAVGLSAQAQLFTAAQASSAATLGYAAGVRALLTYHPAQLWEGSLNLGFVYDRSAAPFTGTTLGAQERFALGINDTHHSALALGVLRRFPQIWLDPFVEISAALGGASLAHPVLLQITPGVRLDSAYGGPLEVTLGAHLRALGAPSATAAYAGLPPWQVFVQVALHVFGTAESERLWNQRGCSSDTECGAQQLCIEGACVVQAAHPQAPSSAPPATLVLRGSVTHAQTHAVLPKARVTITGYDQAPLLADATGRYRSFDLDLSGQLLTVTASAPGYAPQVKTAVAQASQGETDLNFELQPSNVAMNGTLTVHVHVQNSAAPVAGAVAFVPAVSLHAKSNAQGILTLALPEGEYDVLITAKQFGDVRKHVVMRGNDPSALDVELKPQRKRR